MLAVTQLCKIKNVNVTNKKVKLILKNEYVII